MLGGLCGCLPQENVLLLPFVPESGDTAAVLTAMFDTDMSDGFADKLAVVSPARTSSETAKVQGVDAQEIFLAPAAGGQAMQAYQVFKTMPPASLTKILTALTALRSGKDLDQEYVLGDEVIISIADAQVCGFQPGDRITLRTLLYCMLIYSGNDSANAVAAIAGDGDIEAFCESMNEVAAGLGAVQTHFTTPNGLDDPRHYTSAYDLYLIFRECLKYDLFRDAIMQSGYTATYTRNGQQYSQYYMSTSRYLTGESALPQGVTILGGKTGTTDKAGLCLILYVQDAQEKGYISVLLGSPDKDSLYKSMTNLLLYVNK